LVDYLFGDDSVSEKEGIAAADHYLKVKAEYDLLVAWDYEMVGSFLVDHKWQVKRALELFHKAQPLFAKEQEHDAHNDNRSADEEEDAVYQENASRGASSIPS
jgi:hypothetical protein